MRIHTFIDKCNTILKDSDLNFGLNPVAELNMGPKVSRACVHFNTEHLVELYKDKTIANLSKTRHILKLFNCSSVNINDDQRVYAGISDFNGKERAACFDVIAFKIPKDWDEGKGYDYKDTFWISGNRKKSSNGCTWENATNLKPWCDPDDDPELHYAPGIYDTDYIYSEYKKVLKGEKSEIILATQHFDYGAENFELDLTDYVNGIMRGEIINHGVCIAFSPDYETHPYEDQKYVGFFTNNTNLFFEPYLETIYDEYIDDDRAKFYLGKENRLYLYCEVGGNRVNLDELPVCEIDDVEYPVTQQTKGVYYATVKLSNVRPDTILSDVWSNLYLGGEEIQPIEMDFTVLANSAVFSIGNKTADRKELVPNIAGINDAEKIKIGDVRMVDVNFRVPYTTSLSEVINSGEYRVYVKDNTREIDVYDYTPIECAFLHNYFIIDTNEMVPGDYFVDIRTKIGLETKVYKEALRFTIVSNVTQFYR